MKIAEGIDYAITQALAEDLEKTASAEESAAPENTVNSQLRKLAHKLRKTVDASSVDPQSFGKADR